MTEVSIRSGNLAAREADPDPRRWLLLVVIGIAQLMVMLDATIVNIALPSAQKSLGFSSVDRQWVVTAPGSRTPAGTASASSCPAGTSPNSGWPSRRGSRR